MRSIPRIGMIGGGMMAQVGHLPFYLGNPGCELIAVADERPSIIAELSQRIGKDRIVNDRGALLCRPDIDAVVLSAPRPATGPLTLEVLQAGKHVLVEKPMAHTVAQAKHLVEAARSQRLLYAIGFMKRYDPGVQAARALFDDCMSSRRLGQLLLARFYNYSRAYAVPIPAHTRPRESRPLRYPAWPTYPDWLPEHQRSTYEWFVNAASHDVNLVTYFFPGDIQVDCAQLRRDGAVLASLRCGDVPVGLEVAKSEPGVWIEGAEFIFERGRIAMHIPSPMATDQVATVSLDDNRSGVVGNCIETGSGWCFAHQAAGFIDALTGTAPALTIGEAGLADMVLMEAIWRCMRE